MIAFFAIAFFIVGATLGSFFANLIFRLKRNESIVSWESRKSHCDSCGKNIEWYQNIPIISFFFLKGHCGNCRSNISWVYPAFELFSGLIFVFCLLFFVNLYLALVFGVIFVVLLFFSFYDALFFEIDDRASLPFIAFLIVLNLCVTFVSAIGFVGLDKYFGLYNLLGGIVVSIFFLLLVIFTKGKIGGGEIRFGAIIGLILGLESSYISISVGIILAALFSLILLIKEKFFRKNLDFVYRKAIIPLIPFLSIGIFISILYGKFLFKYIFSI